VLIGVRLSTLIESCFGMIGRAGIEGSIHIKELEVGLSKRPRGYSLDEILALGGNGCLVTTMIQNKH
jgi:hypothetical protein